MEEFQLPELTFAKGHGTGNDFIIIPDPEGEHPLTAQHVAWLCDRHRGLGADGILRVIRAGALLDRGEISHLDEGIERDTWFMDYRNADGSLAEMCGNGVRVFAHWLYSRELTLNSCFPVGTRAGVKNVHVHSADLYLADVTVSMGTPAIMGESSCIFDNQHYSGWGIDMGNPHLACVVSDLTSDQLSQLDFRTAPEWDKQFFPHGVNVEILTPLTGSGEVNMRVYERGVGETLSCGTGTVAAAQAALLDSGRQHGTILVHIPGGRVEVSISAHDATLRGPSVILAEGKIAPIAARS
ncbi:diaminopimelate epimerase [Corynebacterium sp. 3HC-13]|uniref:diaminopimelate epimerase n=1 Tax=Corynebacterium poyangense TaxID=2684405 RepID=UPI001CCBCA8E|nr:diaminopimelate epimerase [Corynebacterium poyangense]MBZ8177974.1 diaminopimelate epimerase [Corynebacterium poyangense]